MPDLATIERLRPAALQSKAVRIPQVFPDPDAVLRLIRERAPYPTMAAYHNIQDTMGWQGAFPWFKEGLEDDILLQNPSFLDAARESFSAQIVRPIKCALNVYGPMKSGPPHVDLPEYRGFSHKNAPVWLLMNMTYSGLFHAWMAPYASGLAWFYAGEGGEFEYWPDGAEGATVREESPLWNVGVMSDNEFMWHRVGPIGPPDLQEKLHGALRASDRMHYVGDGAWEIRDGDACVIRLAPEQVRISLLWKAYVFRDEAHLASFKDPAMNLDLAQVVDIYLDDLARRGVKARRPADALADPEWRDLLQATYVPPFNPE